MVRELEISVAKLDIASYQPLVVEIKELIQNPIADFRKWQTAKTDRLPLLRIQLPKVFRITIKEVDLKTFFR